MTDEGQRIGVVVIGRNEGERLRACLHSVVRDDRRVVYVDSGSSDDSVSFAKNLGVDVVELDLRTPFTAAKARNAGFDRLERSAAIDFVQFVDGDCTVAADWIDHAHRVLLADPGLAAVCGRRRERFPERSRYNLLCDMEWDTPIGDTRAVGGDAMFRARPFRAVGGFNPRMIAGEEPELCMRLLKAKWRLLRIDRDMTAHDAAMTRLSQWWRRMERAGHAYAEGAALHGSPPWRHNVKELRSIVFWALVMPLGVGLAAVGASRWSPWGWALLALLPLGYVLLFLRVYQHRRRHGDAPSPARLYAAYTTLAKFPLLRGVLSYWVHRLRGRTRNLIEYK